VLVKYVAMIELRPRIFKHLSTQSTFTFRWFFSSCNVLPWIWASVGYHATVAHHSRNHVWWILYVWNMMLFICHLLLKSCAWFFQFVHRGSLETLRKLWAASSSKVLLVESEGRQTLPRLYQKVQVTEVKGKSFWLSRPAPDTHREAGSQEEACEGPQNSSTCSKSQ
jgi:hypothetical protein